MDPATGYACCIDRRPLAYEGLVAFHRASGAAGARVVGALAQDVPSATAGGLRYVFRLRPGLRYWDGRPVRASDVRPSLERALAANGAAMPPFLDDEHCADDALIFA